MQQLSKSVQREAAHMEVDPTVGDEVGDSLIVPKGCGGRPNGASAAWAWASPSEDSAPSCFESQSDAAYSTKARLPTVGYAGAEESSTGEADSGSSSAEKLSKALTGLPDDTGGLSSPTETLSGSTEGTLPSAAPVAQKMSLTEIMKVAGEFAESIGRRMRSKASVAVEMSRCESSPAGPVEEASPDDATLWQLPELLQQWGLRVPLMPHQLTGVRFLLTLHASQINGILADEMGVGKTIETLAFLLLLKATRRACGPHLIFAPLSIIHEWQEACAKFVPDGLRVVELMSQVRQARRLPAGGLHADSPQRGEAQRVAGDAISQAQRRGNQAGHRVQRVVDEACASTSEGDVVLVPVNLARDMLRYLVKARWDFLVVDEAHTAVANLKTNTSRAILSVPSRNRLVLTGTPIRSDVNELWSLLHFLNPDVFFGSETFNDVFRRPFLALGAALSRRCGRRGGMSAAANSTGQRCDLEVPETVRLRELDSSPATETDSAIAQQLRRILRPFMLRRTKRDIDPTLRCSKHILVCPLTRAQRELLELLRHERKLPVLRRCSTQMEVVERAGSDVAADRPAWLQSNDFLAMRPCYRVEEHAHLLCCHAFTVALPMAVLKRCSDVVKGSEAMSRMVLACSGKFMVLDVLLARASAAGKKVVVFSRSLTCIDLLISHLLVGGWRMLAVGPDDEEVAPPDTNGAPGYDCDQGTRRRFGVLTGKTPVADRNTSVRAFQSDPECLLFLVSLKAGGCGLNLQAAHLVVLIDKDYVSSCEEQAIARVFRLGQRHTVRAVYLTTDDPSESRIWQLAGNKDGPRQAIIERASFTPLTHSDHGLLGAPDEACDDQPVVTDSGGGPAESGHRLTDVAPVEVLDFRLLVQPSLCTTDAVSDTDRVTPTDQETLGRTWQQLCTRLDDLVLSHGDPPAVAERLRATPFPSAFAPGSDYSDETAVSPSADEEPFAQVCRMARCGPPAILQALEGARATACQLPTVGAGRRRRRSDSETEPLSDDEKSETEAPTRGGVARRARSQPR